MFSSAEPWDGVVGRAVSPAATGGLQAWRGSGAQATFVAEVLSEIPSISLPLQHPETRHLRK